MIYATINIPLELRGDEGLRTNSRSFQITASISNRLQNVARDLELIHGLPAESITITITAD